MRNDFVKAAGILIVSLTSAFSNPSKAQTDGIQGWDVKGNEEFVVEDVSTKIKLGKIGTVQRDVHCDCDLLYTTEDKNTGRRQAFLTPAFFAQFNAEHADTWAALPKQIRQQLEKARYDDKTIAKGAVDAVGNHLQLEHGISIKVIDESFGRCMKAYKAGDWKPVFN